MQDSPSFKTRFAPTPSGFLHRGNAASFVLTWAWARARGGKILLRIDDLDDERMRLEYLEDIFQTLDWLGLDYDEGANNVGDFIKNWSQHQRLDLYNEALKKLKNESQLYACICSRKQIRATSSNGFYAQTCRNKSLNFNDLETAWRLKLEEKTVVDFKIRPTAPPQYFDLNATVGDFIVRQKNGLPAYQLASVVDDVFYKITHVVRGEDLLDSTAAQFALANKLGAADFTKIQFFHHPLLLDTEGVKLSKSEGAAAIARWRESGKSPLPIIQQAADWAGFDGRQVGSLSDLVVLFSSKK